MHGEGYGDLKGEGGRWPSWSVGQQPYGNCRAGQNAHVSLKLESQSRPDNGGIPGDQLLFVPTPRPPEPGHVP